MRDNLIKLHYDCSLSLQFADIDRLSLLAYVIHMTISVGL